VSRCEGDTSAIDEEPASQAPDGHAANTLQTPEENTRLPQEIEHPRESETFSADDNHLHSEVEDLKKRCLDVEAENVFLRTQNCSYMQEIESLKERCTNIEAENIFPRSENDRLRTEVETLRKRCPDFVSIKFENAFLRSERDKLQSQLQQKRVFRFGEISEADSLVSHFSGLPNKETFFELLRMFHDFDIVYSKKWKVQRLDKETQLLITLMRLRRGLSHRDLAVRFKVSETTITKVVASWIMALHHILVKNLMRTVPSTKKNQIDLPECFKEYPRTRMIIDCTEVFTGNPTLIMNQNKIYSNYKHRITSKALVGIAPNGTVTFVSKLYAGSTSDRKVVIDCGVLNCLVPGDSLMADKGFNIEDLLPDGVVLNIPPFKMNPQFTEEEEEVDLTTSIAQARIHVERAIARIKNFQILQFIPASLCHYSSEVFQVCAALTNFQRPLIRAKTAGVVSYNEAKVSSDH